MQVEELGRVQQLKKTVPGMMMLVAGLVEGQLVELKPVGQQRLVTQASFQELQVWPERPEVDTSCRPPMPQGHSFVFITACITGYPKLYRLLCKRKLQRSCQELSFSNK